MRAELRENTRILAEIAGLENDWDGYGALSVPKEIIERVLLLMPILERQPDIFPTPDGTIQLEYAISPNKHLNIEILSSSSMKIFEMFDDRSYSENIYDLNSQIINLRIKKLYE